MSNLQKFNLFYIVGLWCVLIAGTMFIYTYRDPLNIYFWPVLFFIWVYSYRPLVNKFFYRNMLSELSYKLEKLGSALVEIEEKKKKKTEKSQKEN